MEAPSDISHRLSCFGGIAFVFAFASSRRRPFVGWIIAHNYRPLLLLSNRNGNIFFKTILKSATHLHLNYAQALEVRRDAKCGVLQWIAKQATLFRSLITGRSNWIKHRKLKYSICCLLDIILKIERDLSISIKNTSISGGKFRWTTLYTSAQFIRWKEQRLSLSVHFKILLSLPSSVQCPCIAHPPLWSRSIIFNLLFAAFQLWRVSTKGRLE